MPFRGKTMLYNALKMIPCIIKKYCYSNAHYIPSMEKKVLVVERHLLFFLIRINLQKEGFFLTCHEQAEIPLSV